MFARESEMTPIVQLWLTNQGLTTAQEVRMQWGICDFVAFELEPSATAQRVELKQTSPIGNPLRAAILGLMPSESSRRGATLRTICKKLGNLDATKAIEKELQFLIKGGYAQRTETGSFKSACPWLPMHRRLVAVELKLRDISTVFAQARQNQEFASESFVALPQARAEQLLEDDWAAEFEVCGIGLIGVRESGCQLLLSTAPDSISESTQTYVVDRLWRATRTSKAA